MPSSSHSLQKYNEAFQKELARLNPAQQKAVDQIEGPVLVIAGPGTGKTHILTARIGRILMETDTQATNILCLTFTEAGVHAMRQRLLEFIGPEAHRVHIFTFHSFCNKVIQENMELFGRHDLEPISELERVELIRKLIDQLPADHELRKKSHDIYYYESHLHDLFQRMKAENWSVSYLEQKIDAYLTDLPLREDFVYKRKTKEAAKGDLKQWKIDEEVAKMNRLRAAARLYPMYITAMQNARRYDFADMILWVVRGFQNNQALLRRYQEQYLYFLIDEYQDTNGAQNQIIQLLIDYWSNPNIFIVGDDDQSIYEFQGARLKNLIDFYETFQQQLSLVLLEDNYRSSQHILDSSKQLIDHNEHRIIANLQEVEKTLKARHQEFASSRVRPIIHSYAQRVQEEADIVQQIENLQKSGIALQEVAVIYAKHRQARNLIELLEKKGIPYSTKRQLNILDLPHIKQLRSLLQYLDAEIRRPYSAEPALFQLLHFHFFEIPPSDLAKLSLAMAQQATEGQKYWRDALQEESFLQKLQLKQPDQLLNLGKQLNHWISAAANLPLLHLLEQLINQSGLLKCAMKGPNKSWDLQVLSTFMDFVRTETDRQPRLQLRRLLRLLDSMDANRLRIPIQKTITSATGLQLLSAHSSKGLEFRYVYILDAVQDHWDPGRSTSTYRFPLPDTLTLSGEEDALEARRRLFYVAMTRAKEYLHISYSEKNYKGKVIQRSQFVDELLVLEGLEVQSITVDEKTMLEAQWLRLLESKSIAIQSPGKTAIDELLGHFSMSISSLNTFLRCPLSFYYEYILRVPTVMSESAAYGTAMHNALRRLFDRMSLSKSKQYPSADSLQKIFVEELKKMRAYLSEVTYEQRLSLGQTYLQNYYKQFHKSWPTKVLIEHPIRHAEVDGVPVKGTIDRIDWLGNQQLHIVDYKTGSSSASKTRPPTKAQPYGGTYWRQLYFYKLLYEAQQSDRQIGSGAISYLEPDSEGRFEYRTIVFKVEDAQLVQALIRSSYDRILAHDFYEGCGETNCPWCNFVRQDVQPDSLVDQEREELDD